MARQYVRAEIRPSDERDEAWTTQKAGFSRCIWRCEYRPHENGEGRLELIQTAGCQFAGGNCDMVAEGTKLQYMVSAFPAPRRCRTEGARGQPMARSRQSHWHAGLPPLPASVAITQGTKRNANASLRRRVGGVDFENPDNQNEYRRLPHKARATDSGCALDETAIGCRTEACKRSARTGCRSSSSGVCSLSPSVLCSHPSLTRCRDFDFVTAIWDLPARSCDSKRLSIILRRQMNIPRTT